MRFFTVAMMAGAVSAFNVDEMEFIHYLMRQGKTYHSLDEFNRRFSIFSGRY